MRQFIDGSQASYQTLDQELSASSRGLKFEVDMVGGITPRRSKIAFEKGDGVIKLYADAGMRYVGDNQEISEWLSTGTKEFPKMSDVRTWFRSSFNSSQEASASSGCSAQSGSTQGGLSNMAQIQSSLSDAPSDTAIQIDSNKLYEKLSKKVIGQSAALKTLSSRISIHVAKTNPSRPETFFSVGPSGVGKTRTAEVLPDILRTFYEDDESGFGYLRLDMSEYQEAHRISQLLGAPQGYVGYGEGSELIDALTANPKTIVLFDEIEKAHPNILRALMNAMDAGRLSTSANGGQSIDCRKAIFLFTSNLRYQDILSSLGQTDRTDASKIDRVCRTKLVSAGVAPELVGRIKRFLVYWPLSKKARGSIFALAIQGHGEEYGLNIDQVEPKVIAELLPKNSSSNFGARPDEYIVEEVFGPIFSVVPPKIKGKKLKVFSSPYRCEAIH